MVRTDCTIVRSYSSSSSFPGIIVAVPACNEADRLGACLQAIAAQGLWDARCSAPVGIVCFINNSDDGSFDVALSFARSQHAPMRIYDAKVAPSASHAGGSRRKALDLAARWLRDGRRDDGILFTTDADSVPESDWIASGYAAMARGVDCVAGPIDLYPEDEAALPTHVQARGRLEARYEALLTELFSHLDPRPHDPWPRHAAEAGANLAITLRAFEAIGGCPDLPCGEDRAMVARVERVGMLVRHDPAMRVATSGRLVGRAVGGVADTIRLRCDQPDAVCDTYLEPGMNAYFRGTWRGRLRAIFETKGEADACRAFGFTGCLRPEDGSFAAFWDALERSDPRLARALLRPADLPGEIAVAASMLEPLRARLVPLVRTDRADNLLSVPAE